LEWRIDFIWGIVDFRKWRNEKGGEKPMVFYLWRY